MTRQSILKVASPNKTLLGAKTRSNLARPDSLAPSSNRAASISNRQMLRFVAAQRVQRQPEQNAPAAAMPAAEPQADKMTPKERMAYVMGLLVEKYHYPELGAAGLVGNLVVESKGLLPNIIEGGSEQNPMRARAAQGPAREFTPEEIMNRIKNVSGPLNPGVGIAQWSTPKRRAGLFKHMYNGKVLGAAILFSLDAQVDYLVKELTDEPKSVDKVLKSAKSVDAASDEVVFNFERPKALLKDKTDAQGQIEYKTDKQGKQVAKQVLRSRTDPAVVAVLEKRRAKGQEALTAYREAKSKHTENSQAGNQ